jgi:hypothetical protein
MFLDVAQHKTIEDAVDEKSISPPKIGQAWPWGLARENFELAG